MKQLAFFLIAVASVVAPATRSIGQEVAKPTVLDQNLQLTLLASEPEIVTPTGLAADSAGRLYVVESHTHSRSREYDGPAHDRIIVFEDADGDGLLERSRIFADGLRTALAIAFSQDGALYAVQMKNVVRLRDADGDGVCETKDPVLTIETKNNNNHGVLLGIVFDDQNRMYTSLGNIGGEAYVLKGSDGSTVAGQGDTGLIVRSRADGSSLERFAHGFWNPPELEFDAAGRLLATDNDPDSRGPNRVLHVIEGGEYGYKARFGGSGLHPYCAWNGELPGTLPMLAGVGEAPVGVLDCNRTSLPEEYAGSLLVGVWGTNEVVRVRTEPCGVSLTGSVQPLIVGDASFRPTNITATADGVVYIADWADRKYPVHGKGRIWRLSAKPSVKKLRPQRPFSTADGDAGAARLEELKSMDALDSIDTLITAAADDDPLVASTALSTLGNPVFHDRVVALLKSDHAADRLTALLTLRKANFELDVDQFGKLLHDEGPMIRRMALIWAGESMRLDLADDVLRSIAQQSSSAELFETFLATTQLLTDEEQARVGDQTPGSRINREIDETLIQTVLADDRLPSSAKAMAVRYVKESRDSKTTRLLTKLAHSADVVLAVEAVRTLGEAPSIDVLPLLASIAADADNDVQLRCEAVMAIAASDASGRKLLHPLLTDAEPRVATTAARALTTHSQDESVRSVLSETLAPTSSASPPTQVAEQLHFALDPSHADRPQSDEQWTDALSNGGDPSAGRRVFFGRRATCSTCHCIDGRGGRTGPNLSNIAAAKTRADLLTALLNPSEYTSPDYQGYLVLMQDGRAYRGTQFHYRGEAAEMRLEDGAQLRFQLSDTEEYFALDESIMPERLEDALSVSEVRDLMAFLESRLETDTADDGQ